MPKTTDKHFQLFKKECLKWIDEFGLKGWSIEFYHQNNLKDSRASCSYDIIGRWVCLYLNTDWGNDKITNLRIRKSAFHEVCETLMCNLRNLAEYRHTTQSEIDEEVHAIIRTLENVVFK